MFSVSHSIIPGATNGTTVTARPPRVGDRVSIQRDETRYPSKGTWPEVAGRRGTVVEINTDRRHPQLTEFGVVFGRVTPRTDGRGGFSWSGHESICWFRLWEIRVITGRVAAQRHAEPRLVIPAVSGGARGLAVVR